MGSTQLGIEAGLVQNAYNKQRIPGTQGTLFDISESFEGFYSYHRLSYIHLFKEQSGLRLLYAPLELSGTKQFEENIDFKGVQFNSNEKTNTYYKFNSYRATYFYQLMKRKGFLFHFGGTLKIRDAKVQLQQGNKKKFKENVGIVPLLYLYSEYRWTNGLRLAMDFDGLVAPQGRAFDFSVCSGYYFTKYLRANLGYRMLEGGADNEKVYNFSLFHYLFSSLEISF